MIYNPHIIKEVVTSTTILQLSEDGIVISKIRKDGSTETGGHIAREIIQATYELCDGNQYPMLAHISNERKLNSEERRYYKNNSIDLITKVAMIVKTPYERLIGNFFMGINKLKEPCKLFNDKSKAVDWLLKDK